MRAGRCLEGDQGRVGLIALIFGAFTLALMAF